MTRHHGLLPRARDPPPAPASRRTQHPRRLAAALVALTLATTATGSAFADTSAATPGAPMSWATVGTTLAPAAATPCFGTQYPSCASSDPQAPRARQQR